MFEPGTVSMFVPPRSIINEAGLQMRFLGGERTDTQDGEGR